MFKILILSMFMASCASKLPRGGGQNARDVSIFDASKIGFMDFKANQSVTLASYMKAKSINNILLLFGSFSCTSCMAEFREIKSRMAQGNDFKIDKFEVVGTIVDPQSDSTARRFKDFDFIRWNDPEARIMLGNIYPANEPLKIPFTAFVSDGKLEWVILANDRPPLDDLIVKIKNTIK